MLIRVQAAGVNNTDINTRIGWYSKGNADVKEAGWSGQTLELPRIQGADICGDVIAVGKGPSPAFVGHRVRVEPCLREQGDVRLPRHGMSFQSAMAALRIRWL